MSAQLLLHLEWIRVQDMADARRCVSKDQKESWVMEGTVRSIAERTVGVVTFTTTQARNAVNK